MTESARPKPPPPAPEPRERRDDPRRTDPAFSPVGPQGGSALSPITPRRDDDKR